MPELPEVECIRRAMTPQIVGCQITAALIMRRDVLITPDDPSGGYSRQRSASLVQPKSLRRLATISPIDILENCTITRIERRGKQLAIIASEAKSISTELTERALVVQLGMTGQLLLLDANFAHQTLNHAHLIWNLAPSPKSKNDAPSGLKLVFRDPRRFGCVRVIPSLKKLDHHWNSLGPDALAINPDLLSASFHSSSRPIKATLLDQSIIAGIGNIYADEALFRARVHPACPTKNLRPAKISLLCKSIRAVLHRAIESGGSTLRDYILPSGNPGSYQLQHAVYGRSGLPCPRCGSLLASTTIAQRTTTFCSACQQF